MSAFVFALIEISLQIFRAHATGNAAEIAKIPGLLIKIVRDVDLEYEKEVGQRIDWSTIRQHEHLGPEGGELPPTPPPPEEPPA